MKTKNRLWAFLSIGLMILVAAMALGGYAPAKSSLNQTTTTTSRINDSPLQDGHNPGTLTWQLTVKVSPSDAGWVMATANGQGERDTNGELKETYKEGTTVKLEARDNVGYEFDYWHGQIPNEYGVLDFPYSRSSDRTIYVHMYQDLQITAHFQKYRELTVDSTEGGTVSPFEGSRYFEDGESVTLTAEAEPGFIFAGWVGDIENAQFSGNQISFIMNTDRTITAKFTKIPESAPGQSRGFGWSIGYLPPTETEELPEDPVFLWGLRGLMGIEWWEDDLGIMLDYLRGEHFDKEPTGTGTPWQSDKGEKPSGNVPDPGITLLEVIVTPGRGGAVGVFNDSLVSLSVTGGPDIDMTKVPVKPSGKPEGTWAGAMTFKWVIRLNDSIRLVAKPFDGYRFVGWQIDKFTPRDKTSLTYIAGLPIKPPRILNPENPELNIRFLGGDLRVFARFAPIDTEDTQPEDALPEDDLDVEDEDTEDDTRPIPIEVNVSTTSDTVEDESGCESIVTIEYEAKDTSTSHPITYVQLDVDGEELSSWSGTPSPIAHYKKDTSLDSACLETRVIQLKAINKDGQTKTTTKDAKIPPLTTHFEWGIIDAPNEGDCKMQLIINYQAVDSGTPENPITNVVIKANGATWQNSGTISSLWYEKSFVKLVDCGQLYRIEVIATDSDGNKYTYRQSITIPEAEPEEPPPPPPPPPPQTTLYAALAASAQCTSAGPECSCQLSISFDGKDLTLGDYPVTQVILKVNGTEWYNSGPISQTHHHNSVTRTVNCGQTFNMVLTVKNILGQTATSTGSITTPIP